MPQLPIIPHGDSVAVVLPAAVVESLGLHVGDVLEATLDDRQLILRPVGEAARRQRLQEITRDVFAERRDAYQRLA